MKYQTIRPIEYDWIKIPLKTLVTKSEEWREHEVHRHIALFVLPDGLICPLFFDEVAEVEKCKSCGGEGDHLTGVEHGGIHQYEECQDCEGTGWHKLEEPHN